MVMVFTDSLSQGTLLRLVALTVIHIHESPEIIMHASEQNPQSDCSMLDAIILSMLDV